MVCHYNCSDESKPFPRYSYKPSLQSECDGCGSPLCGVHLNVGIPSLTKCCSHHDRSDGATCGKTRNAVTRSSRLASPGSAERCREQQAWLGRFRPVNNSGDLVGRVTPGNHTWVAEEDGVGVAVIFQEDAAGGDSM